MRNEKRKYNRARREGEWDRLGEAVEMVAITIIIIIIMIKNAAQSALYPLENAKFHIKRFFAKM